MDESCNKSAGWFVVHENAHCLSYFLFLQVENFCAGYYSYKWAEVLSADAFSAFEEVGLENEEKVAEKGRRFLETVLALGGGRAPELVFKVRLSVASGLGTSIIQHTDECGTVFSLETSLFFWR